MDAVPQAAAPACRRRDGRAGRLRRTQCRHHIASCRRMPASSGVSTAQRAMRRRAAARFH